VSEPETDEPQDDAQAMRADMSDKAFSASSAEIVRSVQVPRDGGDNADATRGGGPDPDIPSRTGSGSVPETPGRVGDATDQ
jgi:hypothetical protein